MTHLRKTVNPRNTYILDVPPLFAVDHTERALPSGTFLNMHGPFYRYACTMADLKEWASDAEHYSDCAGQGWDIGPIAIGLQSSARATRRRAQNVIDAILTRPPFA